MAERKQPEMRVRGEVVAAKKVGWRRIRWNIRQGRRTARLMHFLSAAFVSRELPDTVVRRRLQRECAEVRRWSEWRERLQQRRREGIKEGVLREEKREGCWRRKGREWRRRRRGTVTLFLSSCSVKPGVVSSSIAG